MADDDITQKDLPNGAKLTRSDGKSFLLIYDGKGRFELYPGSDPNNLPSVSHVGFDHPITGGMERVRDWVRYYPDHPPSAKAALHGR